MLQTKGSVEFFMIYLSQNHTNDLFTYLKKCAVAIEQLFIP